MNPVKKGVLLHPCPLAKARRCGSVRLVGMTGLPSRAGHTCPARDAVLSVPEKTCQGREAGCLPNPFKQRSAKLRRVLRQGWKPEGPRQAIGAGSVHDSPAPASPAGRLQANAPMVTCSRPQACTDPEKGFVVRDKNPKGKQTSRYLSTLSKTSNASIL